MEGKMVGMGGGWFRLDISPWSVTLSQGSQICNMVIDWDKPRGLQPGSVDWSTDR